MQSDKRRDPYDIRTSLYVLTYNSPNQFWNLIKSFEENDNDFLKYPRKILINNSTDVRTNIHYESICREYGFEYFYKPQNIGICGGRQFAAQHFDASNSDYYIFFEDDMFLNKSIDNLYYKSLAIIDINRYDFLKLSYNEYYGDNGTQWAWYNIPQELRDLHFPDNNNLPDSGLSENAPKIRPTARKRYKGLSYYEGEYYYCNWPLWFSKDGNKKVFIRTKWNKPYEQLWMSNVFQLQKNNLIKSAVLDLSPIIHCRFDHYSIEERIES